MSALSECKCLRKRWYDGIMSKSKVPDAWDDDWQPTAVEVGRHEDTNGTMVGLMIDNHESRLQYLK